MKSTYFVLMEDQRSGPFTAEQLRVLARSAKIGRATRILRSHDNKTVRAETLKGLFPSSPVTTETKKGSLHGSSVAAGAVTDVGREPTAAAQQAGNLLVGSPLPSPHTVGPVRRARLFLNAAGMIGAVALGFVARLVITNEPEERPPMATTHQTSAKQTPDELLPQPPRSNEAKAVSTDLKQPRGRGLNSGTTGNLAATTTSKPTGNDASAVAPAELDDGFEVIEQNTFSGKKNDSTWILASKQFRQDRGRFINKYPGPASLEGRLDMNFDWKVSWSVFPGGSQQNPLFRTQLIIGADMKYAGRLTATGTRLVIERNPGESDSSIFIDRLGSTKRERQRLDWQLTARADVVVVYDSLSREIETTVTENANSTTATFDLQNSSFAGDLARLVVSGAPSKSTSLPAIDDLTIKVAARGTVNKSRSRVRQSRDPGSLVTQNPKREFQRTIQFPKATRSTQQELAAKADLICPKGTSRFSFGWLVAFDMITQSEFLLCVIDQGELTEDEYLAVMRKLVRSRFETGDYKICSFNTLATDFITVKAVQERIRLSYQSHVEHMDVLEVDAAAIASARKKAGLKRFVIATMGEAAYQVVLDLAEYRRTGPGQKFTLGALPEKRRMTRRDFRSDQTQWVSFGQLIGALGSVKGAAENPPHTRLIRVQLRHSDGTTPTDGFDPVVAVKDWLGVFQTFATPNQSRGRFDVRIPEKCDEIRITWKGKATILKVGNKTNFEVRH